MAQVQLLQCGAGRQTCHRLQAVAEQGQPLQVRQPVASQGQYVVHVTTLCNTLVPTAPTRPFKDDDLRLLFRSHCPCALSAHGWATAHWDMPSSDASRLRPSHSSRSPVRPAMGPSSRSRLEPSSSSVSAVRWPMPSACVHEKYQICLLISNMADICLAMQLRQDTMAGLRLSQARLNARLSSNLLRIRCCSRRTGLTDAAQTATSMAAAT